MVMAADSSSRAVQHSGLKGRCARARADTLHQVLLCWHGWGRKVGRQAGGRGWEAARARRQQDQLIFVLHPDAILHLLMRLHMLLLLLPAAAAAVCCRSLFKSLVPLWCRQIPYTMMKFGECALCGPSALKPCNPSFALQTVLSPCVARCGGLWRSAAFRHPAWACCCPRVALMLTPPPSPPCCCLSFLLFHSAAFENTVQALYKYVVPKPREQCSKTEQLTVSFAAGYIAGVFCAVVSHPAGKACSRRAEEGLRGWGLGSGILWSSDNPCNSPCWAHACCVRPWLHCACPGCCRLLRAAALRP